MQHGQMECYDLRPENPYPAAQEQKELRRTKMRLRFRLKAIPAIIYTALLVLVCISGPFHEAPSDVKPLIGPAPVAEVTLSCGTYPVETTELTAVIQSEDISKLDSPFVPDARRLRGSSCWKEIAEWGQAHPLLELKYTVTLPDGTVLDNAPQSLTCHLGHRCRRGDGGGALVPARSHAHKSRRSWHRGATRSPLLTSAHSRGLPECGAGLQPHPIRA